MGNIATKQLAQGSSFTQDNSMAQFSLTLHPERVANRRIRVRALTSDSKMLFSLRNMVTSIEERRKLKHPT